MQFFESVEYLYALGNEVLAMKLGLETIRLLSSELGNPHEAFPAIHIAGTNGKGSTAAMTEAILRASGYRTGLYTSPHLISITERIRVGGEPIPTHEFARLATQVREAGERLVGQGLLPALPTFFEQVTAIAFLWYAEQKVDLAVLEVGMGGRSMRPTSAGRSSLPSPWSASITSSIWVRRLRRLRGRRPASSSREFR